jgi:hypothetical protein
MGYVPQYMLGHVQQVLDELGLADDVRVKYSPDEDDVDSARVALAVAGGVR